MRDLDGDSGQAPAHPCSKASFRFFTAFAGFFACVPSAARARQAFLAAIVLPAGLLCALCSALRCKANLAFAACDSGSAVVDSALLAFCCKTCRFAASAPGSGRELLEPSSGIFEQVRPSVFTFTLVHGDRCSSALRPPVTSSMQRSATEPRGMQRMVRTAPSAPRSGATAAARRGAIERQRSTFQQPRPDPVRDSSRPQIEPVPIPAADPLPGASSEIEIVNRASAAVAEACEQQVGLVKEALAAACQAELGQLRVFLGEACTAETEKLRLAVTQATNAELQRVSAVLAKAVTQEVETVRSSCMAEVGRVKEALRSACELEVIAVKERCQSEVTQVKAALQQACALEVALVKEACQQEVRCCAPAQSPWPE